MSDGGFVFRSAPIAAEEMPKRGIKWAEIAEKARELAKRGEMLIFDCPRPLANQIRSNLYSVARRTGERVHTRYREGALYVWITFDNRGKAGRA